MNPPSPTTGRGQRPIRKSHRAASSGKSIPGINSAQNFSPRTKEEDSTFMSQDSPLPSSLPVMDQPADQMTDSVLDPKPKPNKQKKKRENRKKNAKAAKSADEDASNYGMGRGTGLGKDGAGVKKVQKKKPTTRKPAATSLRKVPAQQVIPSKPQPPPANSPYGSVRLPIYLWETPEPIDFLSLSDSRKAWKERVDKEERDNDTDPELDDWDEFSCLPDPSPYAGHTREYAVARTLIKRAKRAFWRGQAWIKFEDEELAADSMAHIDTITDPAVREREREDAVENEFRISTFNEIKVRLCHEIWLEEYQLNPATTPEQDRGKRDSVSVLANSNGKGLAGLQIDSAAASDAVMTDAPPTPAQAQGKQELQKRLGKLSGKDGLWQKTEETLGNALQAFVEVQELMDEDSEDEDEDADEDGEDP